MTKKNKIIIVLAVLGLIIVLGGATYAYFTSNTTGTETESTLTVQGGTLEIEYANQSSVITLDNIYPRDDEWVTKNFTVTGTNTIDTTMNYRVGIEVLASGFADGDLTYTLENTDQVTPTGSPITSASGDILASGTTWIDYGQFAASSNGVVHTYQLKIYYLSTNESQNNKQGATFRAKVVLVEAGIGELPHEATYVYTAASYYYNESTQEYDYSSNEGIEYIFSNAIYNSNTNFISSVYGNNTVLAKAYNSPESLLNNSWFKPFYIETFDEELQETITETIYDYAHYPFYLKHELNSNNEIVKTYLEFIITEAVANANDGMVAGTYTLEVADENATNEEIEAIYDSNVSKIHTAFGYDEHPERCNSIGGCEIADIPDNYGGNYCLRIEALADGSYAEDCEMYACTLDSDWGYCSLVAWH